MKIRQACKSDLEIISEFIGLKQLKRKDWHISSKNFVLSYITNKHNFFFIALENDKVVGTINGELWDDKSFAYVGEIVAKGKNKNKTINSLYYFFIDFCKSKGITLVNTYVNKNKKKQIDTYRKFGMKKKGEYYYLEKRI